MESLITVNSYVLVNVFGVYNTAVAKRYTHLTHQQVLEDNLQVMDSTAASLCRDNKIMIHVFGLAEENGIFRAVTGEEIGTIIE